MRGSGILLNRVSKSNATIGVQGIMQKRSHNDCKNQRGRNTLKKQLPLKPQQTDTCEVRETVVTCIEPAPV